MLKYFIICTQIFLPACAPLNTGLLKVEMIADYYLVGD